MRNILFPRMLVICAAAFLYGDIAYGQQANFGVNLGFNDYWSTSEVWANVANTLGAWGTLGRPSIPDPGLTFTSDGYPLENASAVTYLYDYPSGVYQLSYTGNGTVSVSGGLGTLSDVVTVGNTTTANLTITQIPSDVLYINLSNIDPSDPIDNLQVMVPGALPGQIFTSTFLNHLAPVSTIRFMDWSETNGNTDVNWSDRTTPQDVDQTSSNGVALENEIALCNQTGKNGWFNIPVGATDDYIKSMADLLHQTMSPDEKIYIEYSNELWNTSFSQYATNLANAEANPLLTGTDARELAAQQDAYRTMQISQIFKQEFGSADSQVQIVLAGQDGGNSVLSYGLQYLQSNFGNPSNYINDVATAPYVDITKAENVAGLTLDGLFADLDQGLNQEIENIQSASALAKQYGIPLVAYEGGQGLTSWNSTANAYVNQDLMEQAQNDPRMGQILTQLMNAWQAAGGGLFNYFDFVNTDANSGFWGLLENINQTGSVKWDAMLRAMLPLGDVNGDGLVNAADLAIIESNMGQSNMWYQQGDLNGDNLVNADDLALFFLGCAVQQESTNAHVPEPAMQWAILGGAGLIGLRRRRRAA